MTLNLNHLRPVRSSTVTMAAVIAFATAVGADDAIDFNRDIRPILSNNCFACHGPDEGQLEAGLRLDDAQVATRELESGAVAIVPGNPDESELIARVTSDDEFERMPPPEFAKQLSPREIDTLRKWIAQGAPYARHWAYVAPKRPELPEVPSKQSSWPRNAIDHFTLHRMQQHGLTPSNEADRYALIRRVTMDLTGLPPDVDEVDAFVNDPHPQAYEHLVDELLDRPAFGEHWARKWLDLARYADSAGYADDPPRTIWAYRDWVIRAINDNLPFDQFTIEQMAGDLLPNPTSDQLIATAFHRNTMTNNEGGTQDEEFRNVAVVDRVNTTMAVWMGTTMACAQCHSHKYDPISQEDYFRFFAILNNTEDADRRNEAPLLDIYTDEQLERKAQWLARQNELERTLDESTPQLQASQEAWETRLREPLAWSTLTPSAINRASKLPARIAEDATIHVDEASDVDTYTIDLPTGEDAASPIVALQVQTLPDEALPGKGAGHGGGNFVISSITAQSVPAGESAPQARFIRITNPGKGKILSLAEVEVFSHGKNIAPQGTATQHSTDFAGPPELAIDGNTNGDYQKKSVTHTKITDDPWWELDLGAVVPIETVTIHNRTDNNLHTRLKDFTVELLAEDRSTVWETTVAEPPNPSAELTPSRIRPIPFAAAVADYHQPNFEPDDVLTGKTGSNNGWAVGGATTDSHELVLVARTPIETAPGDTLRLTIEQQSPHKKHLLARFRIRHTSDRVAIERARLPKAIVAIVDQAPESRSAEAANELASYYRRNIAPELKAERQELAQLNKSLANLKPATTVPILKELTDNRRTTHLQYRGNYLAKGPELQPGFPETFHKAPAERSVDRLALADWLISPENPLTARVVANRYWETLFGRGIVATSEEFGSQGELPTHPQLLDWLATEFIASGWNRKHLLRTIVLSATYRQSARVSPEQYAADPDNRWLARGPRVRLSAEMVRDQALAVSGLLSHKMFGPPVKPPQPNLGLNAAFGSSTDWKASNGEDRYRRALYTTWRRSNPYPSMAAFDAPNREVCTVRRNRTNTPLQSLVTLNDPVYVEAAQNLARIALTSHESLEDQLTDAFRRCLARPPESQELAALVALYNDARERLADSEAEAMQLATDPLGPLPESITANEAASMTVVANVLLNLDEMFLKR